MKNKLALFGMLVAGLLLGSCITESVMYSNVIIPYRQALAAARDKTSGWTLIDETLPVADFQPPQQGQPAGAAVARALLGMLGGRTASEIAGMLPQQQAAPQTEIRVAFLVPGQFQPVATPGLPLAYFQDCDLAVRQCTSPAMVRVVASDRELAALEAQR